MECGAVMTAGGGMECGAVSGCGAVDAQSLISLSLRKIHASRTQRGGIKLHKNLLVSYVLRNARQLYLSERYAELYRPPPPAMECSPEPEEEEEVIPELSPLQIPEEDDMHRHLPRIHPGGVLLLDEEPAKEPAGGFYHPAEDPGPPPHCGHTTVLDLDTHVVTTVENGFLHQDCCASRCPSPAAAKRRYAPAGYSQEDDEPDGHFVPCKRGRYEELGQHEQQQHTDAAGSSNISNLISIFGSGFTGLMGPRGQQADSEQSLNLCGKQALAGLGAWTRAIVAF